MFLTSILYAGIYLVTTPSNMSLLAMFAIIVALTSMFAAMQDLCMFLTHKIDKKLWYCVYCRGNDTEKGEAQQVAVCSRCPGGFHPRCYFLKTGERIGEEDDWLCASCRMEAGGGKRKRGRPKGSGGKRQRHGTLQEGLQGQVADQGLWLDEEDTEEEESGAVDHKPESESEEEGGEAGKEEGGEGVDMEVESEDDVPLAIRAARSTSGEMSMDAVNGVLKLEKPVVKKQEHEEEGKGVQPEHLWQQKEEGPKQQLAEQHPPVALKATCKADPSCACEQAQSSPKGKGLSQPSAPSHAAVAAAAEGGGLASGRRLHVRFKDEPQVIPSEGANIAAAGICLEGQQGGLGGGADGGMRMGAGRPNDGLPPPSGGYGGGGQGGSGGGAHQGGNGGKALPGTGASGSGGRGGDGGSGDAATEDTDARVNFQSPPATVADMVAALEAAKGDPNLLSGEWKVSICVWSE